MMLKELKLSFISKLSSGTIISMMRKLVLSIARLLLDCAHELNVSERERIKWKKQSI